MRQVHVMLERKRYERERSDMMRVKGVKSMWWVEGLFVSGWCCCWSLIKDYMHSVYNP